MLSAVFKLQDSKNWVFVGLRLIMIGAISGLMIITYPRTVTDLASIRDIVYPAMIGIVTGLVIAIMTLLPPIKKYVPFVVLPADWVLISVYIQFFPSGDLTMLSGITILITVSGIMFVGAIFGTIEAIGSVVALGSAYLGRHDVVSEVVFENISVYTPTLFFVIAIFILAIIWHASLDETNSLTRKEVKQEIDEARANLEDMRERTRAVADMAARLNSTLNFDRILDASLDIGRLSVKNSESSRIISIALMVTNENGDLTIESYRGLQHIELHHTFSGTRGILAEAMDKGEPMIFDGGGDDPELGVLQSFGLVKSTLVIPLRANYETYGVLVFGSTARDAINPDHIDTAAAIGVQATVALQNAVLYTNLRDEKERIIRIEENGRKALVRDLHDIPTQTVAAVAMHLSTIPKIVEKYPERLNDEIENIRGMALRATEEIRHVMFTLRPLSLETSGLSVALEQLAEKMEKTYKQPMQIKVDQRIEDLLDDDAKGSLFYLVEEAANNARKYAEASMIQVVGVVQDNEIILRIRDNGKGFDMNEVGEGYENRGSFGMVNMRERAELINATFDMQSAVGKGTTVTVRVPVKDENISDKVPVLKPRKPLRKQYSGPLSPST